MVASPATQAGGAHAQDTLATAGIQFDGMQWNMTQDEYNRRPETSSSSRRTAVER